MKMFAIKDKENELYFQIEKTDEGLSVIDKIACELMGGEGYRFENRWQGGIPEKEDYEGYGRDGIYLGIVISEKRIHLIIRGIKDIKQKKKIKELITKQYKLM